MGNLGNDLYLTHDGDFELSDTGDFITTDELESRSNNIQFEGEICLRETLYKIIQSVKGSFSFDVEFGADIEQFLGSTIIETKFDEMAVVLENEILKDDRIKSIENIEIEKTGLLNSIQITITLLVIGQQDYSQFVFPYQL